MARVIRLEFTPSNSSALLATTSGSDTSSIPLANPYPYVFEGMTRTITFTSTDDLSGVKFTIVGLDQFGNTLIDAVAGPNNNTVTSINQYSSIINIEARNSGWTNLSIGYGSTGTFQWTKLNTLVTPFDYTIATEVIGNITYSINQTLDNFEYYKPTGPSYTYVYPQAVQLVDNCLTTTNTSATVVVGTIDIATGGISVGDIVTIQGAKDTGGITAAQLNITTAITAIDPGNSFSYVSNGTASSSVPQGGGANVLYYFPALPTSFAITAALTGATTNQFYSAATPLTAIQGLVTASSGEASLIINILQAGIN